MIWFKRILWSILFILAVNTAWIAIARIIKSGNFGKVVYVKSQSSDNGTSTQDINEENKVDNTNFKVPLGQTLIPDLDRNSLPASIYTLPPVIHPNGLNIVFISDNFNSLDEFLSTVQFLAEGFDTIEPWKSYKDFNFFIIFSGKNRACHVETENRRKPTLRCDTRINDLITPLGLYRFKAVIVSHDDFTAWANVTRLNNSVLAVSMPTGSVGQILYRKIFLHEFAHGFGLRDEMTKSVIAQAGSEGTKAGGPNCAPDVKTALSWWGDIVKKVDGKYVFDDSQNDVGFYYGCAGNEAYVKPTIGSLMNLQDSTHPSDDYGPVSSIYLNKVLSYCFSKKQYHLSDDPKFFDLYPDFKACVQ